MSYQASRDCATRYAAIAPILARYTRPFTVLDFGCAEGYFGHRIAQEFPLATVVMIDRDPLCQRVPGTIFLQHAITLDELEELGRVEHFDVVLALSVLHHFPDGARAANAALSLGDHTIIEPIPPTDTVSWTCKHLCGPALWATLMQHPHELLVETPSNTTPGTCRPVLLFETPGHTITKHFFNGPGNNFTMGTVTIDSDYDRKTFTHRRNTGLGHPTKDEHRDWFAGINLRTYLALNGIWPTRESLAARIRATKPPSRHGDIAPQNFIVNRDGLTLIDFNDCVIRDDAFGIEETAKWIMCQRSHFA